LGFKIQENVLIDEDRPGYNKSMSLSMHKRWKAANTIYDGPNQFKQKYLLISHGFDKRKVQVDPMDKIDHQEEISYID
jgi:hypothetical protein